MLLVDSLAVSYGKKAVLTDVTFNLENGLTALLGLNGAGKTTLMKSMVGLVPHKQGQIVFENELKTKEQTQRNFGFAPQFVPSVKSFTVSTFLEYLALLDGLNRSEAKSRVDEVVEICDLQDFLKVRLSELSGGTAKRVSIAQSILASSKVLLLDEPTSGLDPIQSAEIGKLIKGFGEKQPVLFSTHNLAEVQNWATNFLVLKDGKIEAKGKGPELDFAKLKELTMSNENY